MIGNMSALPSGDAYRPLSSVAPKTDAPDQRLPYRPPVLRRLGSLEELTRGIVPVTTDGISPGSSLLT